MVLFLILLKSKSVYVEVVFILSGLYKTARPRSEDDPNQCSESWQPANQWPQAGLVANCTAVLYTLRTQPRYHVHLYTRWRYLPPRCAMLYIICTTCRVYKSQYSKNNIYNTSQALIVYNHFL